MTETGIYVRIKRDGEWQAVDVAKMTDIELMAWVNGMTAEQRAIWLVGLVRWLRETSPVQQKQEGAA